MSNWNKGYHGNIQAISKIGGVFILLLLVLGVAYGANETSGSMNLSLAPSRDFSNITHRFTLWGPQLMRAQQGDALTTQLNLTFSERVKLLVDNSHKRYSFVANKKYGKRTAFGMKHQAATKVYNVGSYMYAAEISFGTPIHRGTLAYLDTGSHLTWVQCAPCPECFHQDVPLFDPAQSHSYHEMFFNHPLCKPGTVPSGPRNLCAYGMRYGGGARTEGLMAFETFSFSNAPIAFGCGHRNSRLENSRAAGVIGLNRAASSLISQLNFRTFSYCLPSLESIMDKKGYLLFGHQGLPTLQYTPLIFHSISDDYHLDLEAITVNEKAVQYPARPLTIDRRGFGGFIIDSGCPVTRLFITIYKPFKAAILSQIKQDLPQIPGQHGLDLCYNAQNAPDYVYPRVAFHFKDLILRLPTVNVFMRFPGGPACLAVLGEPVRKASILGAHQQNQFQVLFDKGNGHGIPPRLGFARDRDCQFARP